MRLLQIFVLFYYASGEVIEHLRYYETLSHLSIKVRKKRSTDGSDAGTQDVSFTVFGKSFNLILTPGTPVIGSDFRAKLVYKDGHSTQLDINENDFFTGHLAENKSIKVDAHVANGLWTANIYDVDDIYTLEPSWLYLPQSYNNTMIAYRHSDIKWNNIFPDLNSTSHEKRKFCQGIHPKEEDDYKPEWDQETDEGEMDEKGSARYKRANPEQNTCQILAVADYTFFSGPGGGFPRATASHIIKTMQEVNTIYRDTVWNEQGLTGMGLQIKELRIHIELTDASNGRHYNMYDGQTDWSYSDLLEQFGEDSDLGKFCLAHLFTHRKFAGGVLGLAYIAPPRRSGVGGMCSTRRSTERSYNIGFSSSMNTKGNNLLSQESMLVTAHEFGHNWGAEHDAETKDCAPNAFNKGKFIMYPYAVSGYDENNFFFSPCSKRYISATLLARSESCFKAEETEEFSLASHVPLCGNGIIDEEEDCDAGGIGLDGLDQCCSSSCKFIGNAKCSPTNFECCINCQMAPAKIQCRGPSRELCKEAAACNGSSLVCPESEHVRNNTPCIDEGKCFKGKCLDYCTSAGRLRNVTLKPCRCEDVEKSCLRCCRSPDGLCKPVDTLDTNFVQDGRPCINGYCEAGECTKTSANMIQRLFKFIEHLDSSTFVAFMRSNIVGTVIVFSLVLWIPLSWTFSCIDKRNEKKSKEHDQNLLSDEVLQQRSKQRTLLTRSRHGYHIKESMHHRAVRPQHHPGMLIEERSYNEAQPEVPEVLETNV